MADENHSFAGLDPLSAASLHVVLGMNNGLATFYEEFGAHFHPNFRWMGNYGCGTKKNLQAFIDHWVVPFRAAFSDRQYINERFLAQGEWVSCFGRQEAIHSGTFMGVAATGKRVKVPYMDFWQVRDGKIIDNWVSVDFASVLAQLGVDVFNGEGWERFDRAGS